MVDEDQFSDPSESQSEDEEEWLARGTVVNNDVGFDEQWIERGTVVPTKAEVCFDLPEDEDEEEEEERFSEPGHNFCLTQDFYPETKHLRAGAGGLDARPNQPGDRPPTVNGAAR